MQAARNSKWTWLAVVLSIVAVSTEAVAQIGDKCLGGNDLPPGSEAFWQGNGVVIDDDVKPCGFVAPPETGWLSHEVVGYSRVLTVGARLDHRLMEIPVGSSIHVFELWPNRPSGAAELVEVRIRHLSGGHRLRVAWEDQNGSGFLTPAVGVDEPFELWVEWTGSSGPAEPDASLRVWVDGLLVFEKEGLTAWERQPRTAKVGLLALSPGVTGSGFHFEPLAVRYGWQ